MALEVETKFFADNLPDLLKAHEGKFALIKGERLAGVFDTAEAAFESGVAQFGNVPILIKRIAPEERIDRVPALLCGWCHA